ncbi:MAG TPA: hypothetical protein VFX25_41170 [Streptosporangiaceae bacterium]|nr:hypothetical protein [Streptosporangiaceae bacterium]
MTDERPDPEWPPGQEAPAEPEPLPRRDFLAPGDPAASAASVPGSSVFERRPAPPPADTTEPLPERIQPLPSRAAAEPRAALPPRTVDPILQRTADALAGRSASPVPPGVPGSPPQRGAFESLPQRSPAEPLPQRGSAPEPLPQRGSAPEPLPQRGGPDPLPQRGAPEPLPQRGASPDPLPQRGGAESLPQRGGAPDPLPARNGSLPRRTGRSQRAGRHRSPHRLSVASDAPALILAVPGSATGPYVRAVEEVAATAETSCPGVEIRVGFLDGDTYRLEEALSFDGPPPGDHPLNGVIVPLLAGPHPAIDATLARAAEEATGQVMLGAHLGGHPLIAEALHARLAEAGIARESRSRGLTMSTATYGVIVLADRGDEAVKNAGVAAVLLASRLSMPAAPASIDDPGSLDRALARLRDSGAERPVISPCLIGPETPDRDLEAVRKAVGAPMAAPLGGHAAIGQLVAIRYGAALARLSMAG